MSFEKRIPDDARNLRDSVTDQFRQWYGTVPLAVIATSLRPGNEHRYLAFNDAYLDLTGYSADDLRGRDFLGDVHPEDQQEVEAGVVRLGAGEAERLRLVTRLLGRAGEIVPARLACAAARHDSGEHYLLTCVEDLTESEQLRAELRGLELRVSRSSRLESVGHLAGGFAHDFKDMLTVIGNYASLVREELSVAEATEGKARWGPARRDLEKAEEAAGRAQRLIAHLLAFAEREDSAPTAVNPGELLGDLSVILVEILGENIPVDSQIATGAWPVEVARAQLEQAIVNIIRNAREAMPGGGRVSVSVRNAELPESPVRDGNRTEAGGPELAGLPPGRYVNLSITDNGPGMDEATAARAFEPFFTTRDRDRSSGLGLTGVRRFATAHGGSAYLRARPGGGTTVTLLLPAAADSGSPELRVRPAPATTVLVVDDEPAIRDVAHRVLSAAGYRVQTAVNGPEAIRVLRHEQIDLVLADVVMPGMTARAFGAQVAEIRPGTRLLFMSGYQPPDDDTADWPAAARQVLAKPFSRAALLGRVIDVLAGTEPARQA